MLIYNIHLTFRFQIDIALYDDACNDLNFNLDLFFFFLLFFLEPEFLSEKKKMISSEKMTNDNNKILLIIVIILQMNISSMNEINFIKNQKIIIARLNFYKV